MVEAFLGRMNDPVPIEDSLDEYAESIDPAFRVIMFTDLKDSTAMTAELGEEKAMHLLRVHNALVRTALREHNGSEVKHTGDGFMVSFRDAAQAISCALDIQLAFSGYNQENPQNSMHIRIGLNAGEPIEEGGDLFGSVVQLASRICDHAEPGAVCASQTVQDNCGAASFRFTDLGAPSLKGFNQPVSIFQVE
jgi:class 3 adenylate cyclase